MDFAANAIALVFGLLGAGLGLAALVSPEIAAKLVRMQAHPDHPDGYAEFRATFGGVFFFLHVAFLVAMFMGQGVIGAAAVLAFGWGGAAIGRVLSLIMDGEAVRTTHNYRSIFVEILAAIAFALPVISFVIDPTG
ncbi:DUF4345 family protein [Hyphobacterium sp.]|uniref:DUF4345 family protein n=1 Tax=Hyphobacterium sp. TaxID=2004662 RepID=UPI003BABEBE4